MHAYILKVYEVRFDIVYVLCIITRFPLFFLKFMESNFNKMY